MAVGDRLRRKLNRSNASGRSEFLIHLDELVGPALSGGTVEHEFVKVAEGLSLVCERVSWNAAVKGFATHMRRVASLSNTPGTAHSAKCRFRTWEVRCGNRRLRST